MIAVHIYTVCAYLQIFCVWVKPLRVSLRSTHLPSKGRYMVWYSDTFSLGTARELPCRAKYVKCRREETSRRPHITISPYYTLFYYRPHSTAAYRYDCFTACWHHCLQAYIVIKIGGKFARRTVALGEPAFGIDKIAYAVHHAFVFARNIEIDVAI